MKRGLRRGVPVLEAVGERQSAFRGYDAAMEKLGADLMASLAPEDKVLVMITRNYGVNDPVLSLAPRCENAAMIMDMRGLREATAAHLMQVHLDGDWDESAWARVRSFLHYCGKKERKVA